MDYRDFLLGGRDIKTAPACGIYPGSIQQAQDGRLFFMIDEGESDALVCAGKGDGAELEGEQVSVGGEACVKAPLTHENAGVLRELFPFTRPVPPLRAARSMGVGDRLGIAADGHIRAFERFDAVPVFAQQSIRELTLTHRTFEEVLDCASFAVFRNGWKRGFGADGDHLKTPEEVDDALRCGYTMITLDCSEWIDNSVAGMSEAQVNASYTGDDGLEALYSGKTVEIGEEHIFFDESTFRRAALIYGRAIAFAARIYKEKIKPAPHEVDFEISIDETATPTEPLHHYFVAAELARRGVQVASMAPRFCGEFQKGVDYRGDLGEFEAQLRLHAAIAKKFGYKLSIHSGSDKFSVFALVGRYTQGRFHVKTAGTSWLEAMRLVAVKDPALYREIHRFALSAFEEAGRYYHVSADPAGIPPIDRLADSELPGLFAQDDARQLIHITYGPILNARAEDGAYRFRDRLYGLWRREREGYAELLKKHIGKHLEMLYSEIQ